jgi:hypothetical protein
MAVTFLVEVLIADEGVQDWSDAQTGLADQTG